MEKETKYCGLYLTSYLVTNGDWPAIGRKYDEIADNLSTRFSVSKHGSCAGLGPAQLCINVYPRLRICER